MKCNTHLSRFLRLTLAEAEERRNALKISKNEDTKDANRPAAATKETDPAQSNLAVDDGENVTRGSKRKRKGKNPARAEVEDEEQEPEAQPEKPSKKRKGEEEEEQEPEAQPEKPLKKQKGIEVRITSEPRVTRSRGKVHPPPDKEDDEDDDQPAAGNRSKRRKGNR